MKKTTVFLLVLISCTALVLSKKNKKIHAGPTHINDVVMGNANSYVRDPNPLFQDIHNSGTFTHPYYHGTIGPQWIAPTPEEANPFMVASPTPGPGFRRFIIPDRLTKTYSASVFDTPMSKDVARMWIPPTRVYEMQRTEGNPDEPGPMDMNPNSFVVGTPIIGGNVVEKDVLHMVQPKSNIRGDGRRRRR